MASPRKGRWKGLRWLRRIGILLAILVALPLILTVVYRFVPPVSTLMLYQRVTGHPVTRNWVALSDIAPALQRAVIASEDARFCLHRGVDWQALSDVIDEDSDRPRGASTIAMQTVKNLFLWPSRDYLRKALEIPLALYADLVLGKRRILEIYLNIAEWGPGTFGAEAGARRAFNQPAARLSEAQAELMAVALPNPFLRDPRTPTARTRQLARNLSGRLGVDLGCLEGSRQRS